MMYIKIFYKKLCDFFSELLELIDSIYEDVPTTSEIAKWDFISPINKKKKRKSKLTKWKHKQLGY